MPEELLPRQRLTLEVGSAVAISALLLGLQLGRWSGWSALVVIACYSVWVIAYSEVTVQVERRRKHRHPSPDPEPPPGEEQ